jgi:UPF0176 protein
MMMQRLRRTARCTPLALSPHRPLLYRSSGIDVRSSSSIGGLISAHDRWQYISLYNYTPLDKEALPALRRELRSEWGALGVLGRIYISQEGINAQLVVPQPNVDALRASFPPLLADAKLFFGHLFDFSDQQNQYARATTSATAATPATATAAAQPFSKLDVRVRDQIVRDGFSRGELDLQDSGQSLPPDQWHRRLRERNAADDSSTLVLDVRNFYEHEVGRFDGATRIMVDTFRDTFDALDDILDAHAAAHGGEQPREVMMYCTGGIRCEKVGAYLRQYRGVGNIQKLHGGIVNYAKFVKEAREKRAGAAAGAVEPIESLFRGKNFVFDQRCVGDEATEFEQVTDDVLGACFQCGEPCDHHTNCSNLMCHGLILQCASCASSYHGACSEGCKQEVLKMKDMTPDEQRAYRKQNARLWKPANPNSSVPSLKYIKFRPAPPAMIFHES